MLWVWVPSRALWPCWQHRAQAVLGLFCLLWAAAAGVCLYLSPGLESTAGTGSAWSKSSANGKMQLLPQTHQSQHGQASPKATTTSLECVGSWKLFVNSTDHNPE